MSKVRVGVVFGGKSGEHEVSLQSAKSIMEAIDRSLYDVVPIGIDKEGRWHVGEESTILLNATDPVRIAINQEESTSVLPSVSGRQASLIEAESGTTLSSIDVFFPVTHGTYGEDGSLQGLFRLSGVPYVGADVLGSAVGMDKDIMKRLLVQAGIPVAKWVSIRDWNRDKVVWEDVEEELGSTVFVKPANLGSSVGISKATGRDAFFEALDKAFKYDRKVVVEESITGREIECAVLGNERPIASIPGEILPTHEWYSYEAKYVDEHGAMLDIPAKLDDRTVARVRSMAIDTYQALETSGMARVDFFLQPDGRLLINEINTLPGFTKISMYPKLWEATGIPYSELISRLIGMAMERGAKEAALVRDFQ